MKPLITIQSPAMTRNPMSMYEMMRKRRKRKIEVKKRVAEILARMRAAL